MVTKPGVLIKGLLVVNSTYHLFNLLKKKKSFYVSSWLSSSLFFFIVNFLSFVSLFLLIFSKDIIFRLVQY